MDDSMPARRRRCSAAAFDAGGGSRGSAPWEGKGEKVGGQEGGGVVTASFPTTPCGHIRSLPGAGYCPTQGREAE